MTSDRDLVSGIRSGASTGLVAAEDPAAVAGGLADDPSIAVVALADLGAAVAAARVRLAQLVVDQARRLGAPVPGSPPPAADVRDDEAAADRQAVRFALVILVPALPAGLAVHLADGIWLAPVLPAAALLALGVVVLAHRRPPASASARPASAPRPGAAAVDVAGSPAVHAADAHLRRALAAWRLHWWERDEPVPAVATWSARLPDGVPLTLVAVDPDGQLDDASVAAMTATAPAAVRVVVLRARSESSRRRGDPDARFGTAAKPPSGSRGDVTDQRDR